MPARILIVEDNPANLELMVYLLRSSGHETLTATNGCDGLAIARQTRPDLIVCDVQMPEMDGYELARQSKSDAALQSIPLVAVTAFAMVGDRDKALAAGFDEYVAKPIEPEEFVSGVEQLLPAALRTTVARADVPQASRPAPRDRRGHTILVVDDVRANLDLAKSLFEGAGMDTIVTRDALAALDLARSVRPDVIVSDVAMPATSGYDFIVAAKRDPDLQGIPFVFLTSTAVTDAERSRGLALGAVKYLTRPIESELLLAEVEACLES